MLERVKSLVKRRAVRWGLEVAALVAVALLASAWQTRHAVHGHAPAISLHALDGGDVVSADLLGKPAVLVFWAPWCAVCRAESGNVSLLQRVAGDSARVVSVASDYDSIDAVRGYVRDREVDYPVLLGGSRTARAFRVSAFPTAYFLDDKGDIKHTVVGYTTLAGMAWRLFL
ncbi:MAG TPA: TlpA disulfide reductase family protein [Myxococcota bacterium]|jgi:thiol-disulfide isomerase/thioredoxin